MHHFELMIRAVSLEQMKTWLQEPGVQGQGRPGTDTTWAFAAVVLREWLITCSASCGTHDVLSESMCSII